MNKEEVNDAVFQALFRQAVIDNFDEEIDSILKDEELRKMYSCSPEFEKRMKKLFKIEKRRSISKTAWRYGRRVASVLIIVLGILFSTLLFNAEVRASVGKVLVEWYEKFTSFTFREDVGVIDDKDWTINYLPEGYVMEINEVLGRVRYMEFANAQGDTIKFSYQPESDGTEIFVDNENHEIYSSEISGDEAYIISATDDEFDNGIIWIRGGYAFDLWGRVEMEELKKMIESILEIK